VNVLSKEAIDEEKVEKEKQKLYEARVQRVVSLRQRETTDINGGSSDNDLKSLQAELISHYKYLKANNQGAVTAAKEFQGNQDSLSYPLTNLTQIAGALLWEKQVRVNRSSKSFMIRLLGQ
jgi:hypothetical protein